MIKVEFGFDGGRCGLYNKWLWCNCLSLEGNKWQPQTLYKNKFQMDKGLNVKSEIILEENLGNACETLGWQRPSIK